ncbi:MAG6450 family protein [Rhizobium giardinii]|uniref:MAG6450 family protein n=1 Tax=Rhizobium giardinii TaxID=56731 RepID=UPI003B8328EC
MGKNGSKHFKIKTGDVTSPQVIDATAGKATGDNFCGINFRYFQQKHECLSAWQKDELKNLSVWMSKQAKRTVAQIQSTTQTCHAHKGKRCSLPSDVSPDVRLYGLDVTAGARVHGFFQANTFFLVWLDRTHSFHD